MAYRYRVVYDRQVKDACALRGVDFENSNTNDVLKVIRQAFGCRLVRYVLERSSLGGRFGVWYLEPLPKY